MLFVNIVGATVTRALQYERFVQARQVFHSTAYRRPTKSDTTFVRTCDREYKCIEKILCLERSHTVLLRRAVVLADVRSVLPHIKECFFSHDTHLASVAANRGCRQLSFC